MSVLFLQTAPPPAIAGTDAVFQEVAKLQENFGGISLNVRPIRQRGIRYPRQLFGLHQLNKLSQLASEVDYIHIYYPIPYFFPFMQFLKKPVVYTITASFTNRKKPEGLGDLRKLHKIVVYSHRDAAILDDWGFTNHVVIPPGIDTSRVSPGKLTLNENMVLLMASAPWVTKQFDLKGVDALLETAASMPEIHIILLWRGLLLRGLQARLKRHAITDRVEVVNEFVDIDKVLERVHATLLVSKHGDIVKSYPHSLIESLVAQKPVIVSQTIPMSDWVQKYQCGTIVDSVSSSNLQIAIEQLKDNYQTYADNARRSPVDQFSVNGMIEKYKDIYA